MGSISLPGPGLEMMVELPVLTSLFCLAFMTFQPLRQRVFFLKGLSNRFLLILRIAAILAAAALAVRIWTANPEHVPLLNMTIFVAMPIGTAIGCIVVLLLRRTCPGVLRSHAVLRWSFVVFGVIFLTLAIALLAEGENWTLMAVFAALAVLEFWQAWKVPRFGIKMTS